MKIQLQIILIIGVLSLLRFSSQAQTTHFVTNTNNSGVGSLRQAVVDASANDIVRLSPSLLTNGTDSIVLTSEIAFSKSLIFKGFYNNTDTLYISGNQTNRIFNISNTENITIDSMVFVNGFADDGGAISLVEADSLIIINSTISHNSATNDGGGLYINSAAYSVTALIITNSNISNNYASTLGGGVYTFYHESGSGSSVTINNSDISNNSAAVGGGVFSSTYASYSGYSSSSFFSFTLNNSIINNNSATIEDGGGIVVTFPSILISNSTISDNYSNKNGGGIFVIPTSYFSPSFLITNSIINNNTANSKGGGIYTNSSDFTITNSTINNNSGRSGGGVFTYSCPFFIVKNSTISNNNSIDNGGGLYVDTHWSDAVFSVAINNSTICNNSANNGGGLYTSFSYDAHPSVTINNSTIINNTAIDGGGVYSHFTIIDVTGSIIWTANGNGTNIMLNSGISRVTSGGYNIFSNIPNGTYNTSDLTNITYSALNLQPLSYNGGITKTMQPGAGSLALNSGDPTDLTDAQNKPILGVREIGAAESNCNEYKTDIASDCYSFTWRDGITYTSNTNTATYIVSNATSGGCDSIYTLNLMVNSDSTTDSQVACDFYTWIDGNTYTANNNTATHTLTNANGCDSIITLNLTINNSNTGTDILSACNSYIWIDGNTYTTNNNSATYTLTNTKGCDSIVTLNLTINNSNTEIDTQTACNSYTWIDGVTYTSSNNSATYILTNSIGCDSVVTLNLIIEEINTSISILNGTLISNEIGGTFQWLYCDNNYSSIPLAVNQSYVPLFNGYYAVEITSAEECIDTTSCIYMIGTEGVDISDYSLNELKAFPNPTNGDVTLELNEDFNTVSLSITDITGKVVYSLEIKNKLKVNLDTETLSKGIYIIRLQTEKKSKSIQLIKQ